MLLLVFSTLNASVSSSSYIYNSDNKAVEAPDAATVTRNITGISSGAGSFKAPQDLIVDNTGKIYVADTSNNRIVIINALGKAEKIIESFEKNGTTDGFNSPKGVFVTENHEIYICDTLNNRIVHLNPEGEYIREIVLKTGDSLPKDFIFKPTKTAVDGTGRIFVASEGFNSGLLEFTAEGKYIRYMGAANVSLTASQLFWRTFSTKEQRNKTASNVSTDYNNLEIDDQGFLFVTSTAFTYWEYESGKAQPLRKLNAKGNDVLTRMGNPSGELDYPDSKTSRATYKGPSSLVDVAAVEYGIYAVLDQNRGRIFVYNSDGELLYEFGGPGDINGGITTAVALDYLNGSFYTLDSGKNQINIYGLTEYGKLFIDVSKAAAALDYATEETVWNKIINENSNCVLAMRGLGTAAYRKQDMETAMEYFMAADDTENYSKAYVFVRRNRIEKNAVWLIAAVIAAAVVFVALKRRIDILAKKAGKESFLGKLKFADYVVFHPIRGFWELKREKRGSVAAALTFMIAACVTKIISSLLTGFIFNNNDINNYNLLNDVFFVTAAIVIWTVTQWCVTVLMNGEGNYKEIFIATGYSLVPYIWLNTAAVILSRFLSLEEAEVHTVLIALSLLYTAFLLVLSIMSTHDYSLGKTLLVLLIILIVIMLILFICMLIIILTQKMAAFVTDLYSEISLRI